MSKTTEHSPVSTKPYHEGFWKGYGQLKQKDVANARKELKEALRIGPKTNMGFSFYLRGVYEPKASQAQAVESVFAKYGITEVWGGKES